MRELPPGQDMDTREFILVCVDEYTSPRFSGSLGQLTAATDKGALDTDE